jgi:hypothetical protein
MLRVWAVTATYTLVLSVLMLASAAAAQSNYRGWRDTRRRPPLEPAEILTAATMQTLVPSNWPAPSVLADARLAAAYRDYARERRDSLVLFGDLTVVAGGAALGASLPTALHGGWQTWPAAAAILLAALGLLLRHRGQEKWVEVSRLYEQRRLGLMPRAAQAPVTPRRRLRTLWRREGHLRPVPDHPGWTLSPDEVARRLVAEDTGDAPYAVVIDGRKLSWNELGRA